MRYLAGLVLFATSISAGQEFSSSSVQPVDGSSPIRYGAASGQSSAVIDPSNSNILYSPFNWNVVNGAARTINAGAYLKTIFGGTSIAINTDTRSNASPYSQLWIRVDNQSWVLYTLAANNPTLQVAAGLEDRKHLLEVIVKSTSETLARWYNSQTVVTITGLIVDYGQDVYLPARRTKNILIYGDSITEGVRVVNSTAANDTDRNDVQGGYAYAISTAFDAEVGIVAFGATGVNRSGTGSVPGLNSSYNFIYAGVPRSFTSPMPDLVIYNEGTNDGGNIADGLANVIEAIMAFAPASRHLVMIPFNNSHSTDIAAAVAAIGSSNVTFVSTAGFFNPSDSSDGIHPYNYSHIGLIAPRLFPLIRTALDPAGNAVTGGGRIN